MKTEYRSRGLCWDLERILTAKRSLKGFQACRVRFPSPSLCHLRDIPSANIKHKTKNTRIMQQNKLLDITGSYWCHKLSLARSFTLRSVTIYPAIYLTCAHLPCVSSRAWFLPYITETSSTSTTNSFLTLYLINQWQISFTWSKKSHGEFRYVPPWEDMNRKERDTKSGQDKLALNTFVFFLKKWVLTQARRQAGK